MRPFDLFITYVSWGSGGKRRPMLVYKFHENNATVFPVTTQYANKSKAIQARHFVINDWAQAGLDRQSYVDTGTPYIFTVHSVDSIKPIGQLTQNDKERLMEFFQGAK